jgi:hypothetical protein
MSPLPPPFARLAILLMASAALTGCGSYSRPGGAASSLPPPGGGLIAGTYLERAANGSGSRPVGGVTVGVFREAFQPGTLRYSPPAPIARAKTDAAGRFTVSGVSPGRYWVAPIDAHAVASGEWVNVTSEIGARVTLFGCTDCPPPD